MTTTGQPLSSSPTPRLSPLPAPDQPVETSADASSHNTDRLQPHAAPCGAGLASPGASSIIPTVANVRDQIIDALITDMAHDDLTWRPVDVDAERRARSYAAADIAANRSTIASIDEFPGSTSEA